jgi:hypothetical protein
MTTEERLVCRTMGANLHLTRPEYEALLAHLREGSDVLQRRVEVLLAPTAETPAPDGEYFIHHARGGRGEKAFGWWITIGGRLFGPYDLPEPEAIEAAHAAAAAG